MKYPILPKIEGLNRPLVITVLVVSCIGIAATTGIFLYFAAKEKEVISLRVNEGANDLIPNGYMLRGADAALNLFRGTFTEITSTITNPDEITSELLQNYYTEDFEGIFGFTNLRYIKKTDFVANKNFDFHSEETDHYTSVENAEYEPRNGIPDNERVYSYRIISNTGPEEYKTTTKDFYGDPTFQMAMDMARDTGKITHRHSVPFYDEELFNNRFYIPKLEHYFFPVYNNLLPTDDLETRRNKLDGFLSVFFETSATTLFQNMPRVGITLTFVPGDVDLVKTYSRKNIRQRINQNDYLVIPPKELTTYENNLLSENISLDEQESPDNNSTEQATRSSIPEDYIVIAKPSEQLRKNLMSSTRWWALALGLFLTAWVISLIIWAHTKTRRVMNLVEQRTRELNERTQALVRSTHALQASENRYRMLANNITDVIFTHDMNGNCTYMSPSVTSQTGHLAEEYIGKPIEQYFGTDQDELIAQGIQETIRHVQSSPETNLSDHPYLFRRTSDDGTKKWLECSITTLKTASGKPEGFLGVSRDITARIEAEQEKEKIESEFRQAQKMEAIGNLAGGVAHDFNNLLTGILGHADMMKLERPLSQGSKRSLNVIETAALRARELTSQLLGFARKGRYTSVLVDLNVVVQDIISLMERTVDKRIVISHESGEETPYIMGDLGQISQVILNMAVNSRDAMPSGGKLMFTTSVEQLGNDISKLHNDLGPGKYSHINIRDTGHGIPAEIIDKVFDPFFTNKEEGKGTGMGLAMAYGVIRNHGGFINVQSEPGEGTEFDIYLPYRTSDEETDSSDQQSLETGSGKVLFIDDEDIIRDLATTMLNRLGYDVLTAENGAVGINVYRKHWKEIAFVIADIIMPEVDGIDCLRELRKINPDLKAILTTGYSRESVADKLNENLAQEFLEKPFRLKTLASAITALLDDTSDKPE